jgi:hypothetical protein
VIGKRQLSVRSFAADREPTARLERHWRVVCGPSCS